MITSFSHSNYFKLVKLESLSECIIIYFFYNKQLHIIFNQLLIITTENFDDLLNYSEHYEKRIEIVSDKYTYRKRVTLMNI